MQNTAANRPAPPIPFPGAAWERTRDLKPGTRIRIGFSYSFTVVSAGPDKTTPGKQLLTIRPTRPGKGRPGVLSFTMGADEWVCVETEVD